LAARAERRPILLFAYGTLMRGYPLHRYLAGVATFVSAARVVGTLLDLGRYPGLVEGTGWVRGELYCLAAAEVLPTLDRQEGYNFERRATPVTVAGGCERRAWAYWYRGPCERARAIAHGDYRRARPRPVA
jgi:gamma-glutamylcyclotransferase (GGCT)/AIG2-like uncharacterized protein YtfP